MLETTNAIILAGVAAAFIIFALVSSFVLPRSNPDFPGRRGLRWYLPLTGALFVAMMAVVFVFGVEEHGEEAAAGERPAATQPAGGEESAGGGEETTTEATTTEETTTEETTTGEETTPAGGETSGGETGAGGGAEAAGPYANGDAAAGEAVFQSAACGSCHVLAAANATGTIGPNLDEAKPERELIIDRVVNGKGAMPPFKGQLSDQQIADVVAYVYDSTHA